MKLSKVPHDKHIAFVFYPNLPRLTAPLGRR